MECGMTRDDKINGNLAVRLPPGGSWRLKATEGDCVHKKFVE